MTKEYIVKLKVYTGIPKGPSKDGGGGGMCYVSEDSLIVEAETAKQAIELAQDRVPYSSSLLDVKKI